MLRPATFTRAALIAAIAASSLPATVQAASVSVPNRCYASYPGAGDFSAYSEPIPVEIEELTPGREIKITLEVKGVLTSSSPMLTASKRGDLTSTLDTWITGMPVGPTKKTDARIVIRDFWLGTELAAASVDVANVGTFVDDNDVDYRVKRRWFVSGLSTFGGGNGNTYYAHYFANSSEDARFLGRQMLGRSTDRCGFLRARKPLSPFWRKGKYVVKIQASATYKKTLPWIGYWIIGKERTTPSTGS